MTLCKRGPLGYFVLYQDDTHAAASKNNFRTTFFILFQMHSVSVQDTANHSSHITCRSRFHLQSSINQNTNYFMIFGTKNKGRRSSRILKIGYKEIGTKVCFFFYDFFFLLIRSNQVSRRTENRDFSITRVLSSRKMKLIFSSDKDQLAGPYFFTEDWMDLAFSQNKITRMHC